jgi:lipopolysaccharide assembly LptE-like protein
MKLDLSMHRSGAYSLLLLLLTACIPYGFTGGGLPSHVRTVAILPFENQTATPELPRELTEALRTKLHDRLGLRDASESKANSIVRGTIQRYEIDIPIGYSANNRQSTTARRMLQLVVDIEMIDQVTGKTLWQRKGLLAEGQYEERGEATGRREAIDKLVNDLIEGAQSQW